MQRFDNDGECGRWQRQAEFVEDERRYRHAGRGAREALAMLVARALHRLNRIPRVTQRGVDPGSDDRRVVIDAQGGCERIAAMECDGCGDGCGEVAEIECQQRFGSRRFERRRSLRGYAEVDVETPGSGEERRRSICRCRKQQQQPRTSQCYFLADWKYGFEPDP